MQEQYKTELDALALGLTKKPTFMGINVRLFFGNLALCALICIDLHTFWGVPIFILLHLVMLRLSIKEPDFFNLYCQTLIKTPPLLNRWYWGKINSYEPW